MCFSFHEKTCLLIEQEDMPSTLTRRHTQCGQQDDMSSISARRRVYLAAKRKSLLVEQGDLSSFEQGDRSSCWTRRPVFLYRKCLPFNEKTCLLLHKRTSLPLQLMPDKHPGGTQEAPKKHSGSTREAPRGHPGGTQEARDILKAKCVFSHVLMRQATFMLMGAT